MSCVNSTFSVFWKRLFIWRAFFQNAITANRKIEFAMPKPSSESIFWKRALHNYAHIYIYIYICEMFFCKAQSMNLVLALQVHFFFRWRLSHFIKELFICTTSLYNKQSMTWRTYTNMHRPSIAILIGNAHDTLIGCSCVTDTHYLWICDITHGNVFPL